jgi:predicted ATP-dependent protease
MIDGDSASITEICALLSAISKIPIKQSMAITGSVNQKGDIQPIGGVNEKIEGFFDVCKARGLDGSHGVIIPAQNVKDLMLKDEVIQAVKGKKFHVYSIAKVEEAIELLTGINAGKKSRAGKYEINTVFGQVEKELTVMKKLLKPSAVKQVAKPKSKITQQKRRKTK